MPGTSGGGASGTPSTPAQSAVDTWDWQTWWYFNQDSFLSLRSRLAGATLTTSSDQFFGHEKRDGLSPARPSESTVRSLVVPALLRALANEHSNDIQSACLIALAKIGDDPSPSATGSLGAAMQPFIKSPVQEVAETAVLALGILGNDSPRSIDFLGRILADDRASLSSVHHFALSNPIGERQRAFAGFALGIVAERAHDVFRRRSIVAALSAELSRVSLENQRDLAVACISGIGITPLSSEPTADPSASMRSLEQELDLLFRLIDAPKAHPLVRANLPIAIARLARTAPTDSDWRPRVVRRALADLAPLSKVDNAVIESDVVALGILGNAGADALNVELRAALRAQVEHGRELARRFALMALAECGARVDGVPPEAIASVKETRDFLIELVLHGKAGLASWAAIALGVFEHDLSAAHQFDSSESRKAFADAMLRARTSDEIGALAIGSGLMHDLDARTWLHAKLDDSRDPQSRGEVAIALGMLGDTKSAPAIRDVLERAKYQPTLMQAAAIGLGLLGDVGAVPHLIDMLAQAESVSSQAAIANALGYIGDARSIAPLIGLLADTERTDRARAFAAVALGMVCDKDDIVWRAALSRDVNYSTVTPTLSSPDTGSGVLEIL